MQEGLSLRANVKGSLALACALLLCHPVIALSQAAPPGLDPRTPITQYVHNVWQIDQGLPQNSVFALAQTRDGYLWIGTESGLARFDGVRFTTFNSSNSSGLKDNYVNALMVDQADNLWVGTWVGGVTRFTAGKSTA
ncbi:MAG: two-component regulator propeller domain-containing protein, partial [Gemmatimonadaceae bacterium]